MNIGQVAIPDFAASLMRGEQAQASRLQQLAMQRELQQGQAVDAALADGGAAALFGNDPAARDGVLSRLAGAGRAGLGVAMPIMQQQQQRLTPMSPEQSAALGLRPGTVAMVDGMGRPQVLQAPDTPSADRQAYDLRMARVNRAPTVTWSDVRDEGGNITGQRSSTGQFNPISDPGITPARAQGIVTQFARGYADGSLSPDQSQRFETALSIVSAPRTSFDAASGQMVTIRPELPPFVVQAVEAARRRGGQGAQPAQPAPGGATVQPSAAPAASGDPPGVPIPGTTLSASPPPAGVSVQQVTPPRTDPNAPSGGDRTRLRSIEVEAQGVRDALQTFRETRSRASLAERASTAAGMPTELSTTWSNAALLAKGEALYNLGVLNGPDLTIIQRTLSDPATLRGLFTGAETAEAQIRAIETLLDQRLRTARAQFGGQTEPAAPAAPAAPTMRWNPATNRVEPITGGR